MNDRSNSACLMTASHMLQPLVLTDAAIQTCSHLTMKDLLIPLMYLRMTVKVALTAEVPMTCYAGWPMLCCTIDRNGINCSAGSMVSDPSHCSRRVDGVVAIRRSDSTIEDISEGGRSSSSNVSNGGARHVGHRGGF